jgi:hypothetical protein
MTTTDFKAEAAARKERLNRAHLARYGVCAGQFVIYDDCGEALCKRVDLVEEFDGWRDAAICFDPEPPALAAEFEDHLATVLPGVDPALALAQFEGENVRRKIRSELTRLAPDDADVYVSVLSYIGPGVYAGWITADEDGDLAEVLIGGKGTSYEAALRSADEQLREVAA